jgi:RND family efflux transporter MFP subunit
MDNTPNLRMADHAHPVESPAPAQRSVSTERSPERKPGLGRLVGIALVVIALAVIAGMIPRWHARRTLAAENRELAVPNVTVVSPVRGEPVAGVAFPAEVKPHVEAPIYARASGYLKRWLVDIGDKVQEGQLLAEIDTPELDQDLARGVAGVAQADAALELAKTTAARWAQMRKTAAVSEQETSEKQSDLALKAAMAEVARATVRRLEELKSFAKVTAPFAGTITARTTDVGQLINAGSGKELFRLAQTGTLRVFVRVPQTLSRAVAPGQSAELALAELPGRKFGAKIVRTAGAMDPESRTLLCELEVDNSRGEILAGSYAQVRLIEAKLEAAFTLPSNTLLFRAEGIQVGVVGAGGKVELRKIKLGRDFGPTVEVLEGLSPSDRVIVNPSDSLATGMTVRPVEPERAAAEK